MIGRLALRLRARDYARLRLGNLARGLRALGRVDFERPTPPAAHRRASVAMLTAASLALPGGAAYAHSWHPKNCCHDGDCRPVPCDELVETRYGIMWRGLVLFNGAQVKPLQDQFCHVCARRQTRTIFPYLPLCAFIQPSS
jgi:hypothetical protein